MAAVAPTTRFAGWEEIEALDMGAVTR
jgi:hypothetical protein